MLVRFLPALAAFLIVQGYDASALPACPPFPVGRHESIHSRIPYHKAVFNEACVVALVVALLKILYQLAGEIRALVAISVSLFIRTFFDLARAAMLGLAGIARKAAAAGLF